jgi:Sulfotransferase family
VGRRSILVTGIPRSGTTWVARLLAQSRGAAMLGREPMNPRRGQFALAGRLDGWARLDAPDSARARTLRRVYAGLEPRTYGRYGIRQWRAAGPRTTLIVKDPFALLSIRGVCDATGAVPVLVFRSAVETLSSYRRMGWTPDTEEFNAVGAHIDDADEAATMAHFWSWGYECALESIATLAGAGRPTVVVSHAELTAAGPSGQDVLRRALGLDPVGTETTLKGDAPSDSRRVDPERLHNFDRTPEEVLAGGRAQVDPAEAARVESMTEETWSRLQDARLPVLAH